MHFLQVFIPWPDSIEVRQYYWSGDVPQVKRFRIAKRKEGEELDANSYISNAIANPDRVYTRLEGTRRDGIVDEKRLALERGLWQAKQAHLPADQRREYPPKPVRELEPQRPI